MPRILRRWSFLKKSPPHVGDDPGEPPERHPHRAVVAGRGAGRPEEQDRPPLGPTGNPAPRPARSENQFGLHLRGDLPATGQGRSPGAAAMRYARDEPALGGSRAGRGSRSPWGPADGPGRMALHQGHCTKDLVVPDNLTLVLLPARSPELNPVENIWQFLRQN